LALGIVGLVFAILLSIAPFLSDINVASRGELLELRGQAESKQSA
jgi:hypothetical protein